MIKGYLDHLAAAAASLFSARARRQRELKQKTDAPPSRSERKALTRAGLDQLNADNREAAAVVFPNDFGNYCGKRIPKKAPRPLTARERFVRLDGMYLERRRNYRFLAVA